MFSNDAIKTINSFTAPLREGVASLLQPRQQGDFFYGNVSGEYNFNFTFRLEGGGFFQTGILVATATSKDGAKGLPVPLKCRWFRRVGQSLVEIPDISSNMYQVSADDIGTTICVSAVAADSEDGYWGEAVGEIGPFELDSSTRRSLENAIGAGGSRFPVRHYRPDAADGATATDLVIHVMQDDVKVVQPGMTERFNKEVTSYYTADFPKVLIHPLDTVKFQLVMSDDKTFHLAALSRTSRDLVALTIRCFHARKYISTSYVLSQLFTKSNNGTSDSTAALDLQMMTSRLTQELNSSIIRQERIERMHRRTLEEKACLSEQLHETICSYQNVVEDQAQQLQARGGDCNSSVGSNNHAYQTLMQRLRDAEREASSSKLELEEVRHRWLDTTQGKIADPFNDGLQEELQQAKQENQRTIQRMRESEKTNNELRRLLAELEKLRPEKEQLVLRLRGVEQEKQEWISNYHQIKNEFDKLQIAHRESQNNKAGQSMIDENRLAQIMDEKNRLNKQIENIAREKERGKNSQESQVERLMAVNAKLLEEKDREEQEKLKISQLYQETVAQLRSGTMAGNGGGDGALVQQQQETIQRLEAENGSLKSRIRKLALSG